MAKIKNNAYGFRPSREGMLNDLKKLSEKTKDESLKGRPLNFLINVAIERLLATEKK